MPFKSQVLLCVFYRLYRLRVLITTSMRASAKLQELCSIAWSHCFLTVHVDANTLPERIGIRATDTAGFLGFWNCCQVRGEA